VPASKHAETLNTVPTRRLEIVVATRYGIVYAYWSDAGPFGKPRVFMQMVYKGRLYKGEKFILPKQDMPLNRVDYVRQWAESVARLCYEREGVTLPPPDKDLARENARLRSILAELVDLMRSWMRELQSRGMAEWPTSESMPEPLREAIELTEGGGG